MLNSISPVRENRNCGPLVRSARAYWSMCRTSTRSGGSRDSNTDANAVAKVVFPDAEPPAMPTMNGADVERLRLTPSRSLSVG